MEKVKWKDLIWFAIPTHKRYTTFDAEFLNLSTAFLFSEEEAANVNTFVIWTRKTERGPCGNRAAAHVRLRLPELTQLLMVCEEFATQAQQFGAKPGVALRNAVQVHYLMSWTKYLLSHALCYPARLDARLGSAFTPLKSFKLTCMQRYCFRKKHSPRCNCSLAIYLATCIGTYVANRVYVQVFVCSPGDAQMLQLVSNISVMFLAGAMQGVFG